MRDVVRGGVSVKMNADGIIMQQQPVTDGNPVPVAILAVMVGCGPHARHENRQEIIETTVHRPNGPGGDGSDGPADGPPDGPPGGPPGGRDRAPAPRKVAHAGTTTKKPSTASPATKGTGKGDKAASSKAKVSPSPKLKRSKHIMF